MTAEGGRSHGAGEIAVDELEWTSGDASGGRVGMTFEFGLDAVDAGSIESLLDEGSGEIGGENVEISKFQDHFERSVSHASMGKNDLFDNLVIAPRSPTTLLPTPSVRSPDLLPGLRLDLEDRSNHLRLEEEFPILGVDGEGGFSSGGSSSSEVVASGEECSDGEEGNVESWNEEGVLKVVDDFLSVDDGPERKGSDSLDLDPISVRDSDGAGLRERSKVEEGVLVAAGVGGGC